MRWAGRNAVPWAQALPAELVHRSRRLSGHGTDRRTRESEPFVWPARNPPDVSPSQSKTFTMHREFLILSLTVVKSRSDYSLESCLATIGWMSCASLRRCSARFGDETYSTRRGRCNSSLPRKVRFDALEVLP